MKRADFFTALRIALAPLFFICYFFPAWTGIGQVVSVWVLIPLFSFMEFTDYLDGYYARKLNQVSDFGKLFDPFADVLANITVLFSFMLTGYLFKVFFLLILYREMGMLFVRMIASRNGVSIGARFSGKFKTVLYITGGAISLTLESIARLNISELDAFMSSSMPVLRIINHIVYLLAVTLSISSFIDYLMAYSSVLKKSQ